MNILKNKGAEFLEWYKESLHELIGAYGDYVESMVESKGIDEMENLEEWLDEEWRLFNKAKQYENIHSNI